jgi:thiamine biosynthesis lipoprotein
MVEKISFYRIISKSKNLKIYFLSLSLSLFSCAPSLYKDTFVVSGTYLEVISPYREAGRIVYEEFKRLDKIFNFYSPDSEITKLNNTYNTSFRASKELIEVLRLSKQVYELTDGAFDVSKGTLYNFWKKIIRKRKIVDFPSKEKINEMKSLGGMDNILIKDGSVIIKRRGLKIDLSGIAKGYMVDKATLKLKEKGIDSALINAGGDIYCLGKNGKKLWRVGIKDPQKVKRVLTIQQLEDEAIATSGGYEQFFEFKGKRYSHLINPISGFPVQNNILSVTVISKNCTTADSFATAFFIMGLEGIKSFFSKNLSTMKVFVVVKQKEGQHIYIFK